MHTTPVTHPPPEVLADRDAGLVAAFEMLCERMGKLEEIAEHWLRREREKEWMQDGQVDSQLMGMPADVNVWRAQSWPMRPMKVTWWAVHIATEDSCVPADLDAGDRQRLRTEEAMDRLNVRRKLLWNGDDPVTCAEAGLESDFDELADAVSEEMFREALRAEGGGFKMMGLGTSTDTSCFLAHSHAKPPEYWIRVASRAFQSFGLPAPALELRPLAPALLGILASYERSLRAAPHKKRDLLLKSKRLFHRAHRSNPSIIQALRDCKLVNFDNMHADFQSL
ncbi:g1239 [Coccomyxa elongata]